MRCDIRQIDELLLLDSKCSYGAIIEVYYRVYLRLRIEFIFIVQCAVSGIAQSHFNAINLFRFSIA